MSINKVTIPVARKISGLTQVDLAKACGVSENTVISWEKGRSEPSISQAYKIAEATGIPLDGLIFLSPSAVKPQ